MENHTRPDYKTDLTPKEIIGVNLWDLFVEHYKMCHKSSGFFPETTISKTFGPETREQIAMACERLMDHGWVAAGVDAHGVIKWRQIAMSPLKEIFCFGDDPAHGPTLAELKKMSQNELIKICRARGFGALVEGIK